MTNCRQTKRAEIGETAIIEDIAIEEVTYLSAGNYVNRCELDQVTLTDYCLILPQTKTSTHLLFYTQKSRLQRMSQWYKIK